jgi:hypothetical protein
MNPNNPDWEAEIDNAPTPRCQHEWVEAVDDDGKLIEPAYDICNQCGITRH